MNLTFAIMLRALVPALLFLSAITADAAPPDLTNGGVPGDAISTNLGPTGMRGWVYHVKENSAESRQIQVKSVAAGSPADGVLAANDVILGASGTGADPVNFSSDARKSFANAINDAEARDPAILKLILWRAGVTNTVEITLETMGAYSATAPYNCPKSALILQQGLQAVMAGETAGRYSFGLLTLLAGNNALDPANAARMARAQTEARALIPNAATRAQMMSDARDGTSMITWQRGHTLVALAEYYLVTADTQVLPAIEAYAVNISKNTSLFGTVGHIFAEKYSNGGPNGPMGGVYGPVNSTGMPCFLGLLLARECGLGNPEIEPAIVRASRFFASYSGKGAIPYGEHEPYPSHENNGKSGLAALCFALQDNRVAEGKFYAKSAAAAPSERETGHTGSFFNYLWSPLGAAVGGEEAAALHFSRIRWMLDLNRRWDGKFEYDCLNGEGPNSGSTYNDFRMSTAALLVYALPLRQLHLTGRGHDPVRWLSAADLTDAADADSYSATGRSNTNLISDTASWSPKIRRNAAIQLGVNKASVTTSQRNQLHGIATNTALPPHVRAGACDALGRIANSASATVLADLLTDSQKYVRYAAAEALRYLPSADRQAQLTKILTAASNNARPVIPFDEEDPLHFDHGRLAMLLFYGGNAYGPKGILYNNITGVNRSLLYPAIRAVAANPVGQARSTLASIYPLLTKADTLAVADAVVDSVLEYAPSDRMFASGVRQSGFDLMWKYDVAEGVPAGMKYITEATAGDRSAALGVLKKYAASYTTVTPVPDVIALATSYLNASGGNAEQNTAVSAAAQAVLDAVAADTNPKTLVPFKGITTATADAPQLTLPASSTVLRVNSFDHALGDSRFTWRKVQGPGDVSFNNNGTAAARNCTMLIGNQPGHYLFEVTMSDSRGLTEVDQTVPVTLYPPGGVLPPNSPPTADAQAVTAGKATPTPIILSGTDPDGYPLSYAITSQPANGTLSGTAPYLVYTSGLGYSGPDGFSFQVTDSGGLAASATVTITVDPIAALGVAVYEPFDYPAGALSGKSGTSEVGLTGTWSANETFITAGSFTQGDLVTKGGKISDLGGGINRFAGARAISVSALAEKGLLDHGATLWFSAIVGYDTGGNVTNSRLALALANSQFNSGNYKYWINNEGAQLGSGIGLVLGSVDGANGRVGAAQFKDLSAGDGFTGNVIGSWTGAGAAYTAATQGLIVGKITWGATPGDLDRIELYQPGASLVLPSNPISVLNTQVNQSTFDTLTMARGDKIVCDEIRFGASYQSILVGTTAMTSDLAAPVPSPMHFHIPPVPSGAGSISMVAASAFDLAGVEYEFTCTSGSESGGTDSGWQDSPAYTDIGLTPGVSYSYTVKARDKSPARNETAASAPASVQNQVTVPNVTGLPQTDAEFILTASNLALGSLTTAYHASTPAGQVISQTPSGGNAGSFFSAVDLVVSLGTAGDYSAISPSNIVDDRAGAPLMAGTPVTYTLTFSQDLNHTTVDAADFSNAGNSPVAIGAISETSPGVFTVVVTPAAPGTLRFQISAGAAISDAGGSLLDTTPAIGDDTVLTVTPANEAPVWASNPLGKPATTSGIAYISSLAGDASDADGHLLNFSKVSGPSWLNVAGNGALSGTPAIGDVGSNVFMVGVTDGITAPVQATLNITVSAPIMTVPNVVGLPQGSAGTDVTAAGLVVGMVTSQYNDTVPAGNVISQNPAAGSSVAQETAVDLVVSLGSAKLPLANPNFDPPAEDTSDNPSPGYGPISSWDRSSTSGGVNNSALPFLEQNAHSGTHVAFNQGNGNLSQTLSGMNPLKTYTVTYFVSERGLTGAAAGTSVSLDGGTTSHAPAGSIRKTDKFRRIVSGPLSVSGASSILRIAATGVSGDNSLLIDTVSVTRSVPLVPDGGFENPVQPGTGSSGYELGNGTGAGTLAGSLWIFGTTQNGITRNGSSYSGTADYAPEGSQAAMLLGMGEIGGAVAGFEPGVSYSLSFSAKGRAGALGPNTIRIQLGDQILAFSGVASVTPGQSEWTTHTSDVFTTSGGAFDLKFVGLTAGDKTSFIDDIRFNFVAESAANLPPVFLTNPLVKSDANEGVAYAGTLANDAGDPNDQPLGFAKVAGPAWLEIAADGTFSGTPGSGNRGINTFTVSASDGIAPPVEATLQVTVIAAVTMVPEVVGLAQASAEAAIAAANLVAGSITALHDGVVPAGHVVSQSPAGGVSRVQGSSVDLVISLGPETVPDDYETWAGSFAPIDLGDPEGDHDKDGLSNSDERVWGLDPTRGDSANPISVPLDPATRTFSYTRRNPSLTGVDYTVWTTTDLSEQAPENPGSWTRDAAAQQTAGTPNADGVETVVVTLSIAPPAGGRLFVRVRATRQ